MSSARERILERMRAVPMLERPQPPDVCQWYDHRQRSENRAQRIARFRTALEAAHAEVHDSTARDWPELLLKIAFDKHLYSLLIGHKTPHGQLLESQHPTKLQLVSYHQPIEIWRSMLFDGIDAALTLARSAIAETGSLILWPDSVEPRLMSLVPPVHFVLLDVTTIHADFHSAIRAEGWKNGLPTNALLVSGPSKTADIQQTLAYGAHGPRELIVILLHDKEGGKAAVA